MKNRSWMRASVIASVVIAMALSLAAARGARGQFGFGFHFVPDTLVVTRSTYVGNAETVTTGEVLPPNCVAQTVTLPTIGGGTTTAAVTCGVGSDNGEYPNTRDSHNVWNNANSDGSFGVTSPVFLDNITGDGFLLDTLAVPTNLVVTSFSSKSELALHRSVDGHSLTFVAYHGGMGFQTAPNLLDVSSSNTPGLIDPTNPTTSQYYRAVVEVNANGQMARTDGNAYSGDNDRSVMKGANGFYYMAGNDNSGNLSKTQLGGGSASAATQAGLNLVNATGAEFLVPGQTPPVAPNIEMVGKFGVTQVGYSSADKPGKDTNYRGLLIYQNTLYVTKGSGGNGINTVYQVGAQGTLPTGTQAQLLAEPTTILPGFPTVLASGTAQDGTTGHAVAFPFGLWFADPDTLYVCDEGDGVLNAARTINGQTNVADDASLATAGVQKWRLINGTWTMLYVLNDGLNVGVPYGVRNYPTSLNPAVGGCRNMTGQHNGDGTVTIYAITSTISTNGDQGADPNSVVKVTDRVSDVTLPAQTPWSGWFFGRQLARFTTIRSPKAGDVYRGVALAPVDFDHDRDRDGDHDGDDHGHR